MGSIDLQILQLSITHKDTTLKNHISEINEINVQNEA